MPTSITHLTVAGAAAVAVLAGCGANTPGAVNTTSAATSSTTSTTTPATTPSSPAAGATTARTEAPISDVPAPANAATMTCDEFATLDLSHQIAVLKAIGATRNFEEVANVLTVTTCAVYPDLTVSDALAGKTG